MTLLGWAFLAGIFGLLITLTFWAVSRNAASQEKLSQEVRNASAQKAAGDVMAEHRDADADLGRLRDGTF